MRAFNNLKVGTKLVSGFLAVAFLIVIVAGLGYSSLRSMSAGMSAMYDDAAVPIQELGAAGQGVNQMRGDVYKFILIPAQRVAVEAAIAADAANVNKEMDLYRATSLSPAETDGLAQFDLAWADYQQAVANIVQLTKAGNETAAIQLLADNGAASNARGAAAGAIDSLVAINVNGAQALDQQGDATSTGSTQFLAVGTVLGVLMAVGLGLFISRAITGPLAQVARAADGIAEGELDQALTVRSRDEIGQLAGAFGRMMVYLQSMAGAAGQIAEGDLTADVTPKSERDVLGSAFARMLANLRRTLSQVAENAAAVDDASRRLAAAASEAGQATNQIAATIQQVAKGTAQQTESVSRTATAAHQMRQAIDGVARGAQQQAAAVDKAAGVTAQISTAVQQVAGSAELGQHASAEATRIAQAGAVTVEASLASMQAIPLKLRLSTQNVQEMGSRSEQIGAIVETIDTIASQTNLLALNAAIEAARAGEHGQGFAVVADEVRKLAEKSASATKEIAGLIKGMQQTISEAVTAMTAGSLEVATGTARAGQAGQALTDILQAVEAVNQQVGAIGAVAQQITVQSSALVTAMDAVSSVVDGNTAATERMSAGSVQVTQATENIASISEENSAATQQVSAATEEVTAQVEAVTASADSLARMAGQLQALVGRFTLQQAVAPVDTTLGWAHVSLAPVLAASSPRTGRQFAERLQPG